MTLASRILAFLSSLPPDRLHGMTTADIAEAVGETPQLVSKSLWSLEDSGRITLLRTGRAIAGIEAIVRIETANGRPGLRSPRRSRKRSLPHPEVHLTRVKGVATPHLDRYASAKLQAAVLSADEFLDVTFRENAFAEEGLALMQAYAALEAEYARLVRGGQGDDLSAPLDNGVIFLSVSASDKAD